MNKHEKRNYYKISIQIQTPATYILAHTWSCNLSMSYQTSWPHCNCSWL